MAPIKMQMWKSIAQFSNIYLTKTCPEPGASVARYVKRLPTYLAVSDSIPVRGGGGKIFTFVNEVPLDTAFDYHRSFVLM